MRMADDDQDDSALRLAIANADFDTPEKAYRLTAQRFLT